METQEREAFEFNGRQWASVGEAVAESTAALDRPIRFRQFCVVPGTRTLLCEGRPVGIGGRAFDLLLALIRARGRIVEKEDLLREVWPSTTVEETNLRFQMASLRKALGRDRGLIKTITGRGYLFAADVHVDVEEAAWGRRSETVLCAANGDQWDAEAQGGVVVDTRTPAMEEDPWVALIDDDPSIREALVGLIGSAGIRAKAFPSVRAYLDREGRSPPGCLVLDVWLPDRNGLEFQSDLAKQNVRLPLIFISGHADVAMSVRAMKAGAVEFLTKPVRHQELLDAIQMALGSATTQEEALLRAGT